MHMKVLILSIAAKGRSENWAQAIKEYMKTTRDDCIVRIADILKHINSLIDKLIASGYFLLARNSPALYNSLYNGAEDENDISSVNNLFNTMLSSDLSKLINEFMPDVIVAGHPFELELLSLIRDNGELRAPVIGLIADYTINDFWFHDWVDGYVIPHENLSSELFRRGVSENKVFPLGIPLSSQFLKEVNRKHVLNSLGFQDKKTLLIIDDGLSSRTLMNTFKALILTHSDFQIIVITSHKERFLHESQNIAVFEDELRIHEFMSVSDILITKPRAITASEAMIKGLPIAVVSTVTDREENNFNYLLRNGTALKQSRGESIIDSIYSLLNNPARIQAIKCSAKSIAKPGAAADMSNLIESMYRKNS